MSAKECHKLLGRIWRRPSKQGYVVHNRFRQIAFVPELLYSLRPVPLGKFRPVRRKDHRHMGKLWQRRPKRTVQHHLPWSVGKVFISPYHMGNSHEPVVDHTSEIIRGRPSDFMIIKSAISSLGKDTSPWMRSFTTV